jgi:hypothetical protein
MYKLTLHDARLTHFYTVLTPQISTGLKVNTRVALDGVFLKRYPFWSQPNEKEKGFWQWTPLLIATRAYVTWENMPLPDMLSSPAYKKQSLTKTLPALDIPFVEDQLLDVSKSGKGFRSLGGMRLHHEREARRIVDEKLGFEHLFQHVHHWKSLPPAQAPAADPRINFESLMIGDRAPKWTKWKVTELEGWVRFVEKINVKGLESGIEDIYIVTVTDGFLGDFEYNWSVAVINLPHPLREGDYVRTKGVFSKLYPYQSRKHEWHWTPLVVAPELVKTERPSHEAPLWQYILGTAVMLGVIAALYIGTKREDERRALTRQKIKERRSARDAIHAMKRRTAETEEAATEAETNEPPQADRPEGQEDSPHE